MFHFLVGIRIVMGYTVSLLFIPTLPTIEETSILTPVPNVNFGLPGSPGWHLLTVASMASASQPQSENEMSSQ